MFLNPVCAQVEANIDWVRLIDVRMVFFCIWATICRRSGEKNMNTLLRFVLIFSSFHTGQNHWSVLVLDTKTRADTGTPTHIFYVATLSGHIWKTTQALNVIKQHYLHRSSKAHSQSISRTESGYTARTMWQESCQHLRVGFRVNGRMRCWTSNCSGLVSFVWQLLVFLTPSAWKQSLHMSLQYSSGKN